MEKLISMIDFIFLTVGKDVYIFHDEVNNYAKFLRQPLMLGMFVPCDLDGNVVDSYFYNQFHTGHLVSDEEYKEVEKYQEAKSRVIFEGFEVKRTFVADGTFLDRVELNYLVLFKNYNDKVWHNCSEITYLESLTIFDLKLTPTAQKQIV